MSKKRKLLFILIALLVIPLVGLRNVNAAALGIKNRTVVCEDDLEVGESTKCYLLGTGESSGESHGFVTKVYTRDGLRLMDAAGYPADTKAFKVEPTSGSEGKKTSDGIINNLICKADAGTNTNTDYPYTGEGQDYACVAFYSSSKDKKNFTVANGKPKSSDTKLKEHFDNQGLAGLMVIGSYTVKLENGDANSGCGEICVKSWEIEEASDYDTYSNGPDAGGATVNPGEGSNQYFCAEVHIEREPGESLGTPETGAFVSYTLLIAGALIAISAIVIVKKNTKIYHV